MGHRKHSDERSKTGERKSQNMAPLHHGKQRFLKETPPRLTAAAGGTGAHAAQIKVKMDCYGPHSPLQREREGGGGKRDRDREREGEGERGEERQGQRERESRSYLNQAFSLGRGLECRNCFPN